MIDKTIKYVKDRIVNERKNFKYFEKKFGKHDSNTEDYLERVEIYKFILSILKEYKRTLNK